MKTPQAQTPDDYTWWTATEMGNRLGLDFTDPHQRLKTLQAFTCWAIETHTATRNEIRDNNIPEPHADMPF